MKYLTGLIAGLLIFSMINNANATVFDFENFSAGTFVYQQYSDNGITFSDNLDALNSTSQIVNGGYALSNYALMPNSYSNGIYILFNMPVCSVNTYVFEFPSPDPEPEEEEPDPEPEEPGESVYMIIYGHDAGGFFSVKQFRNCCS